ncbi:MAG: GntR family transcriptional regulator [Pseudomonadota bacterium]
MSYQWKDNQPIYRQLRELVVARIMDGSFKEGEPVPSVRQVATDYQVNHITVSKAYQELVELGLLAKRRGLGMYVSKGARTALLQKERQHFQNQELPAFARRAQILGLSLSDLVELLQQEENNR